MTNDSDDVPGRDEILDLLEDGIAEAHEKVTSGRVYNPENEKVRIQWIRALAYASGQYRQLIKDKELEEIHERIEALEEREGVDR
ncbi:hypothetical protein [Natronococcus sp. A-GB7]|uniref:hypothetical protein n=1 Tax=Natronococcus sp. A-GB7 TaxID=3037649 RepID=UPI00241E643C|nr:hypothetical protein [Natronococcus sp. A-GB7]MDG5821846.1 hypothetical protein [Natronococcus sp. A-GB7]